MWPKDTGPRPQKAIFKLIFKKRLKDSSDILMFFSKWKEFNHELKLFKTYHSSYGLYRYAGTTHLRITIAPTWTKIKNDAAMLARHI